MTSITTCIDDELNQRAFTQPEILAAPSSKILRQTLQNISEQGELPPEKTSPAKRRKYSLPSPNNAFPHLDE